MKTTSNTLSHLFKILFFILLLTKFHQSISHPYTYRGLEERIEGGTAAWNDVLLYNSGRGMNLLRNLPTDNSYSIERLASQLLQLDRSAPIWLSTGFPTLESNANGDIVSNRFYETDGPFGTLFLYHALRRLQFTRVSLVVEHDLAEYINERASTLRTNNDKRWHFFAARMIPVPMSSIDTARFFSRHGTPSVMAFIERPGRGPNGFPANIRGIDISAHVSPAVSEVARALPAETMTIGVGDGGNEMLGTVNSRVFGPQLVSNGYMRDYAVSQDPPYDLTHTITSSVSNWAGYAIGLELGIQGRKENFFDGWDITAMLNASSIPDSRGRVLPDGITWRPGTVDGFPIEILHRQTALFNAYVDQRIGR